MNVDVCDVVRWCGENITVVVNGRAVKGVADNVARRQRGFLAIRDVPRQSSFEPHFHRRSQF